MVSYWSSTYEKYRIYPMILNVRNVLTKDYKYKVSYLLGYFVLFKKLRKVKIPYWISRSNLSEETIEELNKVVRRLNRE